MLVPPGPKIPEVVNVIVEIPKGRRSKFEVDKELGLIRLDRYLYSSSHYPGDYGFIPQTLAEDGDPLDALVMVNEPTFAGCLIQARPLGLFKMTDKGDNDYKVLCVPNTDPIFAEHHDLWRVPPHYLREVEHFFSTYKALEGEGSEVVAQGWDNVDKAYEAIVSSIDRYNETEKKQNKPAKPVRKVTRRKPVAAKTAAQKKKAPSAGKVAASKAPVSKAPTSKKVTRKKKA
ncbi:MAG: inorganic diphosphatase [Phycisphaeraceae bacterium]|nr:inorganic diphosphatase [Phycisphaeraceae bacterium]